MKYWVALLLLLLCCSASEAATYGLSRATQTVVSTDRPSLTGMSMVYKSSDAMVVGGALTLTGKANQVDLAAMGNDCTFNINGGDSINVAKNYSETYHFDYVATNLTVNLTAKSGSATCRVRITGAN